MHRFVKEGSSITCKYCICSVPADFIAKDGKISINYKNPSGLTYECRRYPPILIKGNVNDCIVEYFGWPWILKHSDVDFWCGEFYPKDGALIITEDKA